MGMTDKVKIWCFFEQNTIAGLHLWGGWSQKTLEPWTVWDSREGDPKESGTWTVEGCRRDIRHSCSYHCSWRDTNDNWEVSTININEWLYRVWNNIQVIDCDWNWIMQV